MEGSEHGTKDKELDNHKKMNVAFGDMHENNTIKNCQKIIMTGWTRFYVVL